MSSETAANSESNYIKGVKYLTVVLEEIVLVFCVLDGGFESPFQLLSVEHLFAPILVASIYFDVYGLLF